MKSPIKCDIMKNRWVKVNGYVTAGGDSVWECPVCRKFRHVYGIEHMDNHLEYCPQCGAMLLYPWEKDNDESNES